ncbi:MAG: hypothetical protein ABR502_11690 [Chitinophagaceae bacterium]
MREKQYESARNNEQAPAEGMASVNTFNPDESQSDEVKKSGDDDDKFPRKEDNLPEKEHN